MSTIGLSKDGLLLAAKIAEAIAKDEVEVCDMYAGLYGENLSKLIDDLAFAVREYSPASVSNQILNAK